MPAQPCGREKSIYVKSNEESLIKDLNVPYQRRWIVIVEVVGLFRSLLHQVKIGMNEAYNKNLLIQTKIIKAHFKVMLTLNGK